MSAKSILIGDAGGTKTDWRLIQGNTIEQYATSGFNAFTHSMDEFKKDIAQQHFPDIDEAFLYCAGADTDAQRSFIADELATVLRVKPVVENDLVGAARATCGHAPGYVCILGTGANASYYDGTTIEKVSASLGYILGDEGSGAYLGKQFLKGIYRNHFSKEVLDAFNDRYSLPVDKAISSLYGADKPNQYLASFVPFIGELKSDPQVFHLIYHCFQDFFEAFFPNKSPKLPVHFVGSVAYHFADTLRQVAADRGIKVEIVINSPIAGLVLYHQNGQ